LPVLAGPYLVGQAPPDPTPPLQAAVARFEAAKQSRTRFTYFHLEHTQNFDRKGKLKVDFSQLFEITYIGALQYAKLLENNGKPLTGKALADEEKRYDDALTNHSPLDAQARAKLQHNVLMGFDLKLDQLATQFRDTVVSRPQIEGRDCLLIDSTPLEQAADAPRRHYRIWLDPVRKEILRLDLDLLADEDGMLKGASHSSTWTYIDGIPVVTHSHADFWVYRDGEVRGRVVADHTYSRYRRFEATTRILPDAPGSTQP
jgi:hypothetical protein